MRAPVPPRAAAAAGDPKAPAPPIAPRGTVLRGGRGATAALAPAMGGPVGGKRDGRGGCCIFKAGEEAKGGGRGPVGLFPGYPSTEKGFIAGPKSPGNTNP